MYSEDNRTAFNLFVFFHKSITKLFTHSLTIDKLLFILDKEFIQDRQH